MTRESIKNTIRKKENDDTDAMIEEVLTIVGKEGVLNFVRFLYVVVALSTFVGYYSLFWGAKTGQGLFILFGSLFLTFAVLGLAFIMLELDKLEGAGEYDEQ